MKLGKLNAKIYLEGIDVTKWVSKYNLFFRTSESPVLQLTLSKADGALNLLPGTLVHVLFNDPGDPDEPNTWFIFYEGSLAKKSITRAASSVSVTLMFNGTTKIFDESKYTKALSGLAPEQRVIQDLLYVNLGLRGGESTSVITDPSSLGVHLLAETKWNEWIAANKGFADFLDEFLRSMTKNSPYFKVIQDSLRILDRLKIYGNDKLYEVLVTIEGMRQLRDNMASKDYANSYRTLLTDVMSLDLVKLVEFGIFNKTPDREVLNAVIVPDVIFTAPPTFNIILPNEYSGFNINVDHTSEPTRALAQTDSAVLASGWYYGGTSVIPTFLSPSNELTLEKLDENSMKSDRIKYTLKFTEEEKLRGVNPITVKATPFELSFSKMRTPLTAQLSSNYGNLSEAEMKKVAEQGLEEDKVKKGLAVVQWVSDYLYYKRRLAARGIGSIHMADFSPHWLVGFPGVIETEEFGPILVTFESINISGDAEGRCDSTITVANPRFTSEKIIKMDLQQPDWYNEDFNKFNIGEKLYKDLSYSGKASALNNLFGVGELNATVKTKDKDGNEEVLKGPSLKDTSIETSAKKLDELWKKGTLNIPSKLRKRKFVKAYDFFKYITYNDKITDDNGFIVNPAYRNSDEVDALAISVKALNNLNDSYFDYLKCPFVYKRGEAVLKWLQLDKNLRKFAKHNPEPDFKLDDEQKKVIDNNSTAGSTDPEYKKSFEKAHDYVGYRFDLMVAFPDSPEQNRTPNGYPVPSGEVRNKLEAPGMRFHPVYHTMKYHEGVDFTCDLGTKVMATADGYVQTAGWVNGYGNYISLIHSDKETHYAHLSKILVSPGAFVKKGTIIGEVGSTGVSTGNHLHYEIYDRIKHNYENPILYLGGKK